MVQLQLVDLGKTLDCDTIVIWNEAFPEANGLRKCGLIRGLRVLDSLIAVARYRG